MENRSLYRKIGKFLELIKEQIYSPIEEITDIGILPCDYKNDNSLPDKSLFSPFSPKESWGTGKDSHAWLYFKTAAHPDAEGDHTVLSVMTDKTGWDATNPQFIIYVDGEMRQGLDVNHKTVLLDKTKEHEIYLYAYTGMINASCKLFVKHCELHSLVEKLYFDIKVPYDSLSLFEEYSYEYANILSLLDDCLLKLDLFEIPSEAFYSSVREAQHFMDEVFYGKLCKTAGDGEPTVSVIGHTHIDCAWRWTLKQTREKVQRSFSTVVELMKHYPEYKFMSSQALLYKNLKEEAPEKYEEVKQLIKDGRWECEGSMWVEADCNLSSGESLVRQILFGKRFFKQEFDVDTHILWLPDVFGYSAALPQILKKSGIDWFVTSKISWNDTNMIPYDTFDWQGIDGTKIHTYFLTAQNKAKGAPPARYTTYVAHTTPAMAVGTYERYQQKVFNNDVLLTFGFGDGGGGPTSEHLEMSRRISRGIPGIPPTKMSFAGDFLKKLEDKIVENPRLPVWQGELYLEYHRGTYTSVHKNKKKNRESEFLYLNAEWLSSVAALLCKAAYPQNQLNSGWEYILTNQFHDIIPGSSIKDVYIQSDKDYAVVKEIGDSCYNSAVESIVSRIDKSAGYVVFNPNSCVGCGVVDLDGVCAYVEGISPKGYSVVRSPKTTNKVSVTERGIENKYYKLTFDSSLQITSIYDKRANREVIKQGGVGNELRIYADYPDKYDAWEWSEYSLESFKTLTDVQSVEPVSSGVRAGIKITRAFMNSTVMQTVWLYDDIERIDFDTEIDWHEKHKMVKTAFPVDINNDFATYEIQYGTTTRPTHKNTSWDAMKFEVCAQKFVDLSDGGFGVTMLNDCKYGHDIHDGVMTLSLLRSPTEPDPDADMGIMRCTYALHIHNGALDTAKATEMAYQLNNPMRIFKPTGSTSSIKESFSIVSSDKNNIISEVVKQAEDSEDMIFRFYECANKKTRARIDFGFDVKGVTLCDLMENELKELTVENNSVILDFSSFEIHTVKVTR